MATELIEGVRTFSMSRDEEGHRLYRVKHLVRAEPADGPYNVLLTPGLPLPGAQWSFRDDVDVWAWCRPDAEVKILAEPKEGDDPAKRIWSVEQLFSTRAVKRCNEVQIEDPLLEPDRIDGSYVKYLKAATHDRFGSPLLNSAHEPLEGPEVEFDEGFDTVRIEQNRAELGLEVYGPMRNRVNDAPLWGLPARCVKLASVTFSRLYVGVCGAYFRRTLDFEVNPETWDRDVRDAGTMVLNGRWNGSTWQLTNVFDEAGNDLGAPDRANPGHFIVAKDREGNPTRFALNGEGLPAETVISRPQTGGVGTGGNISSQEMTGIAMIHVERYKEANFLLLGVPLVLG